MTAYNKYWRETDPSWVDGTRIRMWGARTPKGIQWFRTRDEARKAVGLKSARRKPLTTCLAPRELEGELKEQS